jgi:hypothetical protein
VTYREQFDANVYEERYHDVALQQHSALGLWVVLSLGATLIVVVSYLIYVNLLAPSTSALSVERSLHILVTSTPARIHSLPTPSRLTHVKRQGKPMTIIPQSRAANALLGGQGPALLSDGTWTAQ